MKRDKSKRMESDHLRVANPIRPEDLDRRVTRHGIYPSLPASHGVPWSTYVRSQKVSSRSRSISSSTEALDSDQARQTTRRILQHTRSLPTSSPEPQIQLSGREYRSDSGLSERYRTRTPMTLGGDRSSYRSDYMTEYDDYAALHSRTSPTSSIGMIVRPRTKLTSSHGSLTSKVRKEGKSVPTSSHPIIGESAAMFTDMTDTMLKVLDRRMAINAKARELEDTLAEEAYAREQERQNVTGYLPNPVTGVSLPTQPLYMNTMPRTTQSGIPIAESTPIPQLGPVLHRPTPTPRVPIASEQARSRYLDRHRKSVPSSSNDRSLVSANLAREIQEFCSLTEERRPYEKETLEAMLESMLDTKIKQKQLQQRERDEIYKQMTSNLEKVRAIARESISRASTISVEERQMALSETDFQHIKDKMNKIDQKIKGLHQNWQAEHREAITYEQCDAIRKFYERHVQKYETKYKILYRMLQQALDRLKTPSSGVSVSASPRVSASELTPSLVALDDAATAEKKRI